MSGPRSDGSFEVPIGGLAGGRGQGRRGVAVTVALVAVLGGAFGVARLSDGDRAAGRTAVPDTAAGSAAASTPAASTSPAPRRSIPARPEQALDIPDRPLPGSPDIRFVQIAGRDLRFVDWHPGSGLAETSAIAGVLASDEPFAIPILAPTGVRILLVTPVPGGPAGNEARLVNGLGRTLWTGTDIADALWSADGTLAVLAGIGRRWHLVSIAGSGSTRTDAVATVVELPGEVFLPLPIPNGSITIPRIAPRTVPVGFSADGRWIYGGVVSPELGMVIGEFRVRVDGGRVERVSDFGVGRNDGLVPRPGTLGGSLVDPATGRLAILRANQDTTGGPPSLEVRRADKSFAFDVDVPALLGSAWGDGGSLYVLWADEPRVPNKVTLTRVGADGSLGPPLLEADRRGGSVRSASLLGVRGGYAALVLWASGAATTTQVVLVDLADPTRVSALPLPIGSETQFVGVELRPPTAAP